MKNKGFTLVEVVIVLVVIAVLVGLTASGVQKYVIQSKLITDKNNITTLANNIISALDSDVYLSEAFDSDVVIGFEFMQYNKSDGDWETIMSNSNPYVNFTYAGEVEYGFNNIELEDGTNYTDRLKSKGYKLGGSDGLSKGKIASSYVGYILDSLDVDTFDQKSTMEFGCMSIYFYKIGDDDAWHCYYLGADNSLPSVSAVFDYIQDNGSLDNFDSYVDDKVFYGNVKIGGVR